MGDRYSTIHQHEPLRTPAEWGAAGKRYTAQLEALFDELYSRLNRLKMTDLAKDLRGLIQESADETKANRTAIEQTSQQIQLLASQESVNDLANHVARLAVQVDGITLTVSRTEFDQLTQRLITAESIIAQNAQEISLCVTADGIASAINQTNQSVLIDASKINLNGYVTLSSLSSNGTTNIDGGRITTGTIAAGRIDVNNLYVKHLDSADGVFTGVLTAGHWKFNNGGSVYNNELTDQQVRMDVNGGIARYSTKNLTAQYGSTSYDDCRIFGGAVTLDCASTGQSVSARNGYWGSYSYAQVCLVCDQAGSSYETAAGNLGTTDNRWDILWVDTIHYNTRDTSSSRETKHCIKPLNDFGSKLDQLQPVSYKYIDDKRQRTRYGLIYEDTIRLLPDICHETVEGGHKFKGISYEDLITVLLKEVQNLRLRVAELEEKA